MKKIFLLLLLSFCLLACSKAPLPVKKGTFAITVFTGTQHKKGYLITAKAVNDNNVAYYKLFSGNDGHWLCVIAKAPRNAKGIYIFQDNKPKGDPVYYMIAYMTKDSTLTFDGRMIKIGTHED